MSKYNISGIGEVTVVHKMADGSIRENISGYQVDVSKIEPVALRILQKWATEVSPRG